MKAIRVFIMAAILISAGNLLAGESKGKRSEHGMRGRQGMRGGMRSRIRNHILGALQLTEQQKEQAKAIRDANEEKIKKYAEALREAHKAIREASMSDEVDKAAVRELAKNAGDAMAEMAILRAEMKKEFEAILTDEQKAKLEEKKAELKERMEMMKEKSEKGRGGFKKECD